MSVFSKVYENMMEEIRQKEGEKNRDTDLFLTSVFYSAVISSFEWGGKLPKFTKPIPDYIEECFFGATTLAYFEHKGEKYITPCFPSGILLNNGLYDTYTCIFFNGEQVIKKLDEIEICYNNSIHLPSISIVEPILKKCIDTLRAVDMSLKKASFPAITFTGDEQLGNLVTQTISDQYNNRNPYALIKCSSWHKDMVDKIDLFDNRVQDVLAQWDVFVRYKNLFFTTFGINNVEITKSERLTKSEGESNTEITRYGLFNDMYKHRIDWIKRIKEHFGDELTCDINRNYETVSEITMTTDEKRKMREMVVAPYLSEMNGGNSNEEVSKED